MKKPLYIIALLLIIAWLAGYFIFDVSGLVHVLLVIALIAVLLQTIKDCPTRDFDD